MAAIETEGLTKYYGDTRGIEDLDLAVERGEVFGYLGPNGAGKTTTIRTLLGFVSPTSGSATVLGRDVTDRAALRAARRAVVLGKFLSLVPAPVLANTVLPVVVYAGVGLVGETIDATDLVAVHLPSFPYLFACAALESSSRRSSRRPTSAGAPASASCSRCTSSSR